MTERFEVQRTIPADAADIFRVVCSPQGHVAIDASGMLQSASGEPAGAVGDTFVIHMDREALGDLPSIGHYYGYRLEPGDDGTTVVTSIYDWSQIGEQWKASGMWPIIPESALKATLGLLERTVRTSS